MYLEIILQASERKPGGVCSFKFGTMQPHNAPKPPMRSTTSCSAGYLAAASQFLRLASSSLDQICSWQMDIYNTRAALNFEMSSA